MAGNHVLLETIALTQTTSSVTFDNLPTSGYTDLKIVISGRSTRNNTDVASDLGMVFNGVTSGYNKKGLNADGSGTSSFGGTNGSYIDAGLVQSSYATANTFSSVQIYIPGYRGSQAKTCSIDMVTESNVSQCFSRFIVASSGITNPITSIYFYEPNGFSFVAGSTFSIYGVAASDLTPAVAPKATGGNIVANDGTYWYHAFTSSGSFIPQTDLTADVLVVGGGGAGANDASGGGGAGRVQTSTGLSLSSGINYASIVGAGGARNTHGGGGSGYKGADSSFSGGAVSIASLGGGGGNGRSSSQAAVNNGWNGGGGSYDSSRGPTAGNGGNAGGATTNPGSSNMTAGGGGGATAAGSSVGGSGTNAYSSWLSPTSLGVSGYIAGGGGGGYYNSNSILPAGGSGGGGTGGNTVSNPLPGTASTGSGGGGQGSSGTPAGGLGGSGVVIIKYAMV